MKCYIYLLFPWCLSYIWKTTIYFSNQFTVIKSQITCFRNLLLIHLIIWIMCSRRHNSLTITQNPRIPVRLRMRKPGGWGGSISTKETCHSEIDVSELPLICLWKMGHCLSLTYNFGRKKDMVVKHSGGYFL